MFGKMKSILMIFFSFFIFHFSLSQNITSDTTLAKQYNRKAKAMLDKRQFDKLDSILYFSEQAGVRYARYRIWDGLLSSLCNQMQVYMPVQRMKKIQKFFTTV